MRILIKTFRLSSNYGCILQAYALQKVLRDLGHDVVTWDTDAPFYKRMSRKHRFLSISKQIFRKYFLWQKNIILDIDAFAAKWSALSNINTKKFVEKHISRLVTNDLQSINGNQFDCVIAGSDQIWRYYGNEKSLKNNFLEFTKNWNCKRIAYAISFGLDKLNYSGELKTTCKKLVTNFDAISVREDSGVKICKEEFDVDAIQVLDPTLLLKKEDYLSLIDQNEESLNKGELLYYILDETDKKKQIIKQIADQLGFHPFSINAETENPIVPFDWRIQPPVEEWLQGFSKAKFVVTDSFHACIFSIIFNKPFICLGNEQRGLSRFHSLLSMFSLQKQFVDLKDFDIENVLNSVIDWNIVNEKICDKRLLSYQFLNSNIECCSQKIP